MLSPALGLSALQIAPLFPLEIQRIDGVILTVGGSRYARRGKRITISGSYVTQIVCVGSVEAARKFVALQVWVQFPSDTP